MRGLSKDMHAYVAWQDMRVGLIAENVSWSPDVAQDMTNRIGEMWHNTLLELYRFGMLGNDDTDDDDEFGPSPERELQNPYVVYLKEDEADNG